MTYENEAAFESKVREIINDTIVKRDSRFTLLTNKKAVDILIHKRLPNPELFFIEVKFHKHSHGRLGFGNSKGRGFQPEILENIETLEYFKNNLRWVLACDNEKFADKLLFLSSSQIKQYVSGKGIGVKFNNIKLGIFNSENWLTEIQFCHELHRWLGAD